MQKLSRELLTKLHNISKEPQYYFVACQDDYFEGQLHRFISNGLDLEHWIFNAKIDDYMS